VCGLGNLNSVPDIFCELIVFLVVGAHGFRGRLVGDEALLVHHSVVYPFKNAHSF